MDSLTQIVLGASVGEVVAGKKLGNKALLWGAVAGTIPDLDVLINPWLDTVQQLSFHRSITHSFLFALVVSPVLGWLLHRLYKKHNAGLWTWTLLFFFGFTTHALLDACTTWGTQLFWPFSNYGVAFYNIFVIDPLYTLPFLGFTLATAFYSRHSMKRRRLNYTGLALSTFYLLLSFVFKAQANDVFEQNFEAKSINQESYISKPTPLNTVFWSVTAKTENGFYNGFYSLADKEKLVPLEFEPQQQQLLEPYMGHPKLDRLLELTKGYYTVEQAPDKGILINDLRFGKFDGWRENGGGYVFVYHVWKDEEGQLQFDEINNRPNIDKEYFAAYWNRIRGNKSL
ncbi:metal-dependent hydrolase [Pontibacter cellulosilyticus]|uniref:Metal-dependent hydrolase n=1 Tax=Pontibacter cellulosilyticus TaxID=1720253 RepID=A0A923SM08_9BACT|nr:metal-dependent hydrolase [Pontibacter cellulosilyticus]MBC5991690.1 metal-dependent hydrolase [Pontibacter cellulosilyticus]